MTDRHASKCEHPARSSRLSAVLFGTLLLLLPACSSEKAVSPTGPQSTSSTATAVPTTVAPTTEQTTTVVQTTTTLPTPTEVAGTLPTGDCAFLGSVYTLPVGELTMAFRQFGTGPDLLLISSSGGMDLWPCSTLAGLSRQHRVTIYDNRGMVRTSDTETQFTYEDLADDAVGLIGALGLDRPAVFGWSTGGEVGLVLAARHPEAISALAITGSTAGGSNAVKPSPELVACMAADVPPCDLLALMFTETTEGKTALAEYAATYVALAPPMAAPGMAAKYTTAAELYWDAAEPDLDAITVPVLVMNGELDQLAPTANAEYLASRIGDNAQLEIDPGKLHCWFIEHPDRFFSLMEDFLGTVS